MPTDTDPDFAPCLRLLPSSQRPSLRTILAFSNLARTEATAASRPVDLRIARLRLLCDAIDQPIDDLDPGPAAIMAAVRRMLAATAASPSHLRHLLQARERQAGGWRPDTWRDVVTYGQLVAAPVGRLVLEICGEDAERCGRAANALSTALWVLHSVRHLDGDAPDYPPICIPRRFLADALIGDQLSPAGSARGQVRAVLDRVLDGVDRLLLEASPLPRQPISFRMRWHAAVTLCRASTIASILRHRDPFYGPIRLTRAQRWLCLARGLLQQIILRRR